MATAIVMQFLRYFFIMAFAFALMLALLAAFSCVWNELITPAHAFSCSEVRAAVERNGEYAVRVWAKAHGMSDEQIAELKQRCKIR